MEMFGRRAANRKTAFTSFVNTMLKRWRTNAVIVPVTIVPKQDTTRIIAVLNRPFRTSPSIKAVAKFPNCGTSGRVNTLVPIYSSWVLNAPISTTRRGIITIRQHITRNAYLSTSRVTFTHLGVSRNL